MLSKYRIKESPISGIWLQFGTKEVLTQHQLQDQFLDDNSKAVASCETWVKKLSTDTNSQTPSTPD